MLRAVTIAVLAMSGIGAPTAPAKADGPAGDRPYRRTPYEAVPVPGFFDFKWSGFYAGAHLGGGHTNFEGNETIPDPLAPTFPPLTLTYSQDATSVVGGVQAGLQMQWEKIVAGAELTYTVLPFDTTEVSQLLTPVTTTTITRTAQLHDLVTLTGRLGYADGRWLAYAKGGWATAEAEVGYRNSATGEVSSSGGRENGWIAGVGIDYALTYNLFLGIEYNYLHFRIDPPLPPVPGALAEDGEFDIQTLLVRLNYRFGGP
jgi:opacity protein-like surface antigen